MKRLFLILSVVCVCFVAKAQYASINIDTKTIAAMEAAFAAEIAQETFHYSNIEEILKSYEKAELATAGILESKRLDYQALTDLTPWANRDENWYYKRIYKLVSQRIIPKTIQCVKLMIKDPSTAIYWGPYIIKTSDDVMNLCKTFESVVTNGRLSFQDIAFIQLKDEIAEMFDLRNLGGVDWGNFVEKIGDQIEEKVTKENIKTDLNTLLQRGVGLAAAGLGNITNALYEQSGLHSVFNGNIAGITQVIQNYGQIYEQLKDNPSGTLLALSGLDDLTVADLFDIQPYSVAEWLPDLGTGLSETEQYTQKFSIVKRNTGTQTLYSFYPNNNVNQPYYWRIQGSATNKDMETAKKLVYNYTGWSPTRISQLQIENPRNKYTLTTTPYYITSTSGGSVSSLYLSYSLVVTLQQNEEDVLYETVFDSFTMDYDTFYQLLLQKRDALLYELSEDGDIALEIVAGERNVYPATDAAKSFAGYSRAIISTVCTSSQDFGEGTTTWKCRKCGSTVNAHTREDAMLTTLQIVDDALEDSELMTKLNEYTSLLNDTKSQLAAVNTENSQILWQLANATLTAEEVAALQSQYSANNTLIQSLEQTIRNIQADIDDVQAAISEMEDEDDVQTDDYKRIPYLMQQAEDNFGFVWTDAGSWRGNTFVRHAKWAGFDDSLVTFEATVTIVRTPKRFLGILIRRAIAGINWKITGEATSTQVAEIVELDPTADSSVNSQLVNQAMSKVAQAHPDCKVKVDYENEQGIEIDTPDEDAIHLLWASDRLKVAQEVDSRLTKIYSDLVMIEKFLHYKYGFAQEWAKIKAGVKLTSEKKTSIAEERLNYWKQNAANVR